MMSLKVPGGGSP